MGFCNGYVVFYISCTQNNNNTDQMADIKKFKVKYTELIGDETELEGEMIMETKNIQWSMEQFCNNRQVIKMDWRQIKQSKHE